MARKYIVDSIAMWAKEYRIKGFRFDLMGLIDTKTMKAVKEACYEIDPDIILYGEHYNVGANPKQTINYASCHDNWTLTDQLYYTYGNRNDVGGSTQNVLRGVETGFASIFASNGIAFMLGGEELLRTKF